MGSHHNDVADFLLCSDHDGHSRVMLNELQRLERRICSDNRTSSLVSSRDCIIRVESFNGKGNYLSPNGFRNYQPMYDAFMGEFRAKVAIKICRYMVSPSSHL